MEDYFEEEDFNTEFSGQTVRRILQQVVPYMPMVVGFLFLVVLITLADSIFTYFGKQLVDNAIIPQDPVALQIDPDELCHPERHLGGHRLRVHLHHRHPGRAGAL